MVADGLAEVCDVEWMVLIIVGTDGPAVFGTAKLVVFFVAKTERPVEVGTAGLVSPSFAGRVGSADICGTALVVVV